jgi:hypothetical protein
VKGLLAVFLAICAPFTGLVTVGPALVLSRAALREIRADPDRQGGRFVALAGMVLASGGVALIAVLGWAAVTEERPFGLPAEEMPAFIGVVIATSLAALITWAVTERLTGRVARAMVAVGGAAVVVGILAAGFASPDLSPDCIRECAAPDRLTVGLRAALITGAAAAGLALSLWAVWWVATHRKPSRASEEQVAGIATALGGLQDSAKAFRRPEARKTEDPEG